MRNVKHIMFSMMQTMRILFRRSHFLMLKMGSHNECVRKQDEMDSDEEAASNENSSKQTRKVSYHYNRIP